MAESLQSLFQNDILTKYHQAINAPLGPNKIHTERARVIVLSGDVFYSPNSSYLPRLPSNDGKPFCRDANKDDVDEIQQPLWWVEEMAYLPFVPKQPAFHVFPFDKLYSNPLNVKLSKNVIRQHGPDSLKILNWKTVEEMMQDIFSYFRSAYSIPEMKYIVPTTLVQNTQYRYLSQYKAAEKRSRKWFAAWMGLLSFAIAVGQTWDKEDDTTPLPQWMDGLLQFYDAHVAAGIRQELALFSDFSPRAGVFLKIMDKTFRHPIVDFFVRWNIPVWYPWGDREEYHLRLSPVGWSSWKPPSHLIQEAKSFLVKAPVVNRLPPSGNEPAWKMFVERRQSKSRELARSGAKPVKLPKKVFVWEKDEDGTWKRLVVHKRDQEETLAEYGAAQKYYDKLTNEWDCCKAMGAKTLEEMQEDTWDDEDDDGLISMPPVPTNYCIAVSSNSVVGEPGASDKLCSPDIALSVLSCPINHADEGLVSKFTSSTQLTAAAEAHNESVSLHSGSVAPIMGVNNNKLALLSTSRQVAQTAPERFSDEEYKPETYSPEDTLHLLYGFIHPTSRSALHLPEYPVDKEEASAVKAACGVPSIPDSYFKSATGQATIDFVKYLSQTGSTPRNEIYDLSCSNHKFIKKSRRLNFLRKFPGDVFIFKLGDCAAAPWSLAVKGTMSALLVLRLEADWNEYRVAYELLNRGLKFYTLHLVPMFSPSDLPAHIPRIRLSSARISKEDYDLYKQERANLLCNPRIGRAALKEGGILWRLSIELSVSYSEVLAGPTANATLNKQCRSFNPGDGRMWIDDYLQDSEKDILCGTYKVYTGRGIQQATTSWWPTASLWDEIIAFPIWNDRLEGIYLTRLKELESGYAKPRTVSEWRKHLKAHSVVRRSINNSIQAGSEFLASVNSL